MKTSIASTLSVAGVLAAGAAAFAVNTAVLDSGSKSAVLAAPATTTLAQGAFSNPLAPLSDGVTTPEVRISGTETTTTVESPMPVTALPTTLTDTTTTYKVGSSGSVVVDTATGRITVVSVVPASGWKAEPAMILADGSLKIHFTSTTNRVEFVASMANGKVKVDVTNESITPPTMPSNPRYDDDDDDEYEHEHEHGDDDEHEDDEHEDDEHEDD